MSSPASAATYKTVYDGGYFTGKPSIKVAKSASAAYVLPKLHCNAGENSGVGADVTIWDGTHTTSKIAATAGIDLMCINGTPTYRPEFNINGKWTSPKITVRAGNQLEASVSQTASGTSVALSNLSTHKIVTRTGPGATSATYAIIAINWQKKAGTNHPKPVPNFGKVRFTGSKVNGSALGSVGYAKYVMYAGTKDPPAANAHLLVDVSALAGKTTFTCTFKRST